MPCRVSTECAIAKQICCRKALCGILVPDHTLETKIKTEDNYCDLVLALDDVKSKSEKSGCLWHEKP